MFQHWGRGGLGSALCIHQCARPWSVSAQVSTEGELTRPSTVCIVNFQSLCQPKEPRFLEISPTLFAFGLYNQNSGLGVLRQIFDVHDILYSIWWSVSGHMCHDINEILNKCRWIYQINERIRKGGAEKSLPQKVQFSKCVLTIAMLYDGLFFSIYKVMKKNLKQSWLSAFWKKVQNTQEVKENTF